MERLTEELFNKVISGKIAKEEFYREYSKLLRDEDVNFSGS